MLPKKGAVLFAPYGLQLRRDAMTLLSYALGGSLKNSVVEYFSETPDLALVNAVIAHAAPLAESEDIVVAVFDVRRAYFYDTFVELPDLYLPSSGRHMLGSSARHCTELAQLQRRGEMS